MIVPNKENHATKVVLVTGGAGEIGSAICQKFAENGFNIIITYNSNAEKASKLLDVLPKGNHSIFHAPTTDAQKVKELQVFVHEKLNGCLWVVHSIDLMLFRHSNYK